MPTLHVVVSYTYAPTHVATIRGRRPATGDRRPATGDRRPATDDRRPASGDRRPASGDRRQATGDRRQATGDRRPTTGDQRQATGDRRPATGDRASADLYLSGEEGCVPPVPGYRLRHMPRPPEVARGGGGVGFYMKHGLSVRVLSYPVTKFVEQMLFGLAFFNDKRKEISYRKELHIDLMREEVLLDGGKLHVTVEIRITDAPVSIECLAAEERLDNLYAVDLVGLCVVWLKRATAREQHGYVPESRLHCPLPPANCSELGGDDVKKNIYKYNVDGDEILTAYYTQDELQVKCNDRALLESRSLPRFSNAVNLSSLELTNCYAPRDSYLAALAELNISHIDILKIKLGRNKKLRSPLLPELFVGLNVSKLYISGSFLRPIYPDNGFFDSLHDIRNLELMGISMPSLSLSNQLKSVFALSGKSSGEWGGCEYLENLSLNNWDWADGAIPMRWLADCSRLQVLNVNSPSFQKIINNGFTLPSAVYTARFIKCKLTTLSSSKIFAKATNLTYLDMTGNFITHLPRNPLGNLCDPSVTSALDSSNATARARLRLPEALVSLSLMGTKATQICASWPRDMPALTQLDLSHTLVTELPYEAVQWFSGRSSNLTLKDTAVKAVVYDSANYRHVLEHNCTQNNITVQINKPLTCDCHTYWFVKTLAACPGHLAWSEKPKCRSGKLISQTPLEDMVCWRVRSNCTPGCDCFEDIGATIANCTDAELDRMPVIPRLSRLYAASNHISDINSTDIPDTLVYADLRNNSISHLSAEAAQKLFSIEERRVLLAGNSLLCDCENWPLLDALYQHQNQVLDYKLMACLDERPLNTVNIDNLCALSSTALLLYSLAPVVMLLIASLVALGICYYYRYELKVYLYARGCCTFWVHEEERDRDKKFDAFVSYSHADEQFVHEHLVPELEREPNGFRLCIHTRDWLLGEWIPTQIAVSVEQSRRTIIVLSRNFLSSIWGRLEFRTAHINAMQEGRTRVIIILLDDINDHEEMDGELKAYLSSNTYVKWGDPHFWEKLRYALPHRRGERKAYRSGEEVARDLQRIMMQQAITSAQISAGGHPPQMLCIEAAPATAGAAI
ncbi:LOW QUALITY PROTEIN: uncharacterized protein ACR2FA_010254 [Aphomia sociella]